MDLRPFCMGACGCARKMPSEYSYLALSSLRKSSSSSLLAEGWRCKFQATQRACNWVRMLDQSCGRADIHQRTSESMRTEEHALVLATVRCMHCRLQCGITAASSSGTRASKLAMCRRRWPPGPRAETPRCRQLSIRNLTSLEQRHTRMPARAAVDVWIFVRSRVHAGHRLTAAARKHDYKRLNGQRHRVKPLSRTHTREFHPTSQAWNSQLAARKYHNLTPELPDQQHTA